MGCPMRRAALVLALLASAALVLPAAWAGGRSGGCVNDDDGLDDDVSCPQECASATVVIPDGQRCGGDRNGCCQKGNTGEKQNTYAQCNNPTPDTKPAYCSTSIKAGNYWTPWDCDRFQCKSGSICTCNTGDCTCTSAQNFNNIKGNGKGCSIAACGNTRFGARTGSPYACQNK